MKYFFILFIFFIFLNLGHSQCNDSYDTNQSPKIANYDIRVDFDPYSMKALCNQDLRWRNTSPDTIYKLRMYMYMNAFKDLKSTYLRGGGTNIFGQDLLKRTEDEWGYITISKIEDQNKIALSQEYIQPNDQNKDDQSVVEITLKEPILPGETASYFINFEVKLPKTIVRPGYGKDGFSLFVHWFPQMGVYEQNKDGKWGWNCHQFMRGTEFFADFGDYNVEIIAPEDFVIGGSGCKISEKPYDSGEKSVRFEAYDLIDFGWVAYPRFEVYTSTFNGVDIEILMPPEHCDFADRYLKAIEHSLEYLEKNVGEYPYPKITVVDPPVHTLNSGFMEYPMMITCATFYGIPKSVRSVESLVIHEFTHMYFMATLASNEKEEAWMDEGFVTYYEDRILDHYYGEKGSFFNVLGFRSGNAENSRLEYTGLPNPSIGPIARPGWEIQGHFKGLVYSKMATVLKTLEGYVSRPIMDEIIQTYFEAYKFKHPKEADFRRIVSEVLASHELSMPFDDVHFLEQCLHGSDICDYALEKINGHQVYVSQKGGFVGPVEVEVTFEDGTTQTKIWDGKGENIALDFKTKPSIVSAHIDPKQCVYLDINFTNNSKTIDTNTKPIVKYASKGQNWMQALIHFASFLM